MCKSKRVLHFVTMRTDVQTIHPLEEYSVLLLCSLPPSFSLSVSLSFLWNSLAFAACRVCYSSNAMSFCFPVFTIQFHIQTTDTTEPIKYLAPIRSLHLFSFSICCVWNKNIIGLVLYAEQVLQLNWIQYSTHHQPSLVGKIDLFVSISILLSFILNVSMRGFAFLRRSEYIEITVKFIWN